MDYNDVLDELEGLSKDVLLERAIANTNLLYDMIKKNLAGKVDMEQMFTILFPGIIYIGTGVDGRVDKAEYEMAVKFFEAFKVQVLELSQFRQVAETMSSRENIESLLSTVKYFLSDGIMGADTEVFQKKYIEFVACVILFNESIDSKEIEFLKRFCDMCNDISNNNYNSASSIGNSGNDYSFENSISTVEDLDVEIVRHNAVLTKDDDEYYLSVGVELKNPNVSRIANNVNVRIIIKDVSGRILETSEKRIDNIDSNSMFYYGDEICIRSGRPANYTVQVNTDEFVDGPANSTFAQGITFSHYNLDRSGRNYTEFSCNVHNGYNVKLSVTSYFVFYDANNNIVGGCNGYLWNSLYPNSEDVFSQSLYTVANRSTVRASASFDFYDLMD